MGKLAQDVTYAWRQLRKTPGFTATAVLTLALGIGANAAIFTLVNAVLLKNLPVTDPKTLVRLGDVDQCCVSSGVHEDGDYSIFSTSTYEQLKKNPELEDLAAMQAGYLYRPLTARRDRPASTAQSVMAEFVSANYFHTFGLSPSAGRLIADSDDSANAPPVAVMSYQTWESEYNQDPSVIGTTFWMNTKAVTIIGIAPKGFWGDRLTSAPPEFYLPIESMPLLTNADYVHDPDQAWLYLIGRVKPGTALQPLHEKLSAQLKQLLAGSKKFSAANDKLLLDKVSVPLTPGGGGIQDLQEIYASNLKLLMWIAAFVLLIACANIANLLLVRGMNRRSEMALRAALGAMRGRIVRQLITESLLLSAIGGAAALCVSYGGAKVLIALAFSDSAHIPIHSSPSPEVLLFAVCVAALAGLLFGVAPAVLAAKAQPADALRVGARTTTGAASLVQRGLVVGQTSLSLILLVAAGLFAHSLNKLQHTDMKLDATNRYIAHINPQAAGYATTQVEPLYREIEDRLHAVPGVVKVGIASYTPMEDNNWGSSIQFQGQPNSHQTASYVKVNAEYFDSVGTRVITGRGIGVQDTSTSPPVAVVNQAFVSKYFKVGESPIGRYFGSPSTDSANSYEIVGVVENTIYSNVSRKDRPMYFLPILQRSASAKRPLEKDTELYAGAIVIKTSRPMNDMESLTRRTISTINPNLAVVKFQSFGAQIEEQFTGDRLLANLMTLFGALALLLASVGLYGVTAYSVARRTNEIAIRMALGASRSGVLAMILRIALGQTVLGIVIGIPLAWYCERFVRSQLYNVTGIDQTAIAAAISILLVAACVAGLIPGRRAASIDPMKALRSE